MAEKSANGRKIKTTAHIKNPMFFKTTKYVQANIITSTVESIRLKSPFLNNKRLKKQPISPLQKDILSPIKLDITPFLVLQINIIDAKTVNVNDKIRMTFSSINLSIKYPFKFLLFKYISKTAPLLREAVFLYHHNRLYKDVLAL